MNLEFYKYQGTGNDFVMVDNRSMLFPKEDQKLIEKLCERKFGIGADGLILLENHPEYDFTMVYYNADGNESTMCGNGGRCLVAFAKQLGVIKSTATFMAVDGLHYATVEEEIVNLQMIDVTEVDIFDTHTFLNTGSPHHVQIVDHIKDFDVFTEGRRIRNGAPYFEKGSNVNFVTQTEADAFAVRTYERGVEDETLSCGTGVTAVALAMYTNNVTTAKKVKLSTPGGELSVSFEPTDKGFTKIFLSGPATYVFKGNIVC